MIFFEKTEVSAFTCKGTAFCILTAAGVVSGDIDRGSGASAVFVIGTFLGFAVNVDFFTAALLFLGVRDGICSLFAEASAAGFVCTARFGPGYLDLASGTELVFVVNAGGCAAIKNCHDCALLIDFGLRRWLEPGYPTKNRIYSKKNMIFVRYEVVFAEKQNICKKNA